MDMKCWGTYILILYSAAALAMPGEIRIYLNPDVAETASLRLADIAKIEAAEQNDIAEIVIPERIYRDGYVEASEVRALLNEACPGLTIRVFGSAVRVTSKTDEENAGGKSRDGELAMQNGDRVDVVLRHKGIVVRTFGTALSDGKKGDRVFVKTANSKRLSGKIAGRGMVEVLP